MSRLSTKSGLTTKIHAVCASDKFALKFHLSAENRHDAPEGRKLIDSLNAEVAHYLLMDRAYEDDETRALVFSRGLVPVVPQNRTENRLGFMIRKFTNVATRLSVFFFGSSVFAKFLLVTTSLILFIFLFLLWL